MGSIENFLIRYNDLKIYNMTPTSIKDNVKKSIEENIIKFWFKESDGIFLNLKSENVGAYIEVLGEELKELEDIVASDKVNPKILDLNSKKEKEYNNIMIQYMTGNFKGIKSSVDVDWEWNIKKAGLTDKKLDGKLRENVEQTIELIIAGGIAATEDNLKKMSSKQLKSDSEDLFEYDLKQLAIFYNKVLDGLLESYKKNDEDISKAKKRMDSKIELLEGEEKKIRLKSD